MNRLLIAITVITALCVNMHAIAQEGVSDRAAKVYVYKTIGEKKLKMHVDFPPGWKKTDTRPVIVFFHGGSWKGGSVRAFSRQAEYFASRGLVCARADYRIKNKDGVTPDKCVEDARSAVRWVRANAAQLGIDSQKLITAGGSAGGHLAACAIIPESVEAEDDDQSISTIPQAMVLFNPVLSFMHGGLSSRVNGDEEIAEKISPLLYVKADTPPSIVMFGTSDRLKAFGDLWWAKAKEMGFRADKFTAEGGKHGFFNRSPWLERTMIAADEFLASLGYLEGEPTIEVPTGEKLKALHSEQDKKAKERGKQAETPLPVAKDLSSHGVTQADLDGLDAIMLDVLKKGTITGCSYLVAHKGEVVYRKAHGEFTTDERVPLASVSKPFAASVIMALAEQGKLGLEDPVEKYLPEFKGIRVKGSETPARPMTIRHVLSHMAGFWGNKGISREKIGLIRDFSQTLEESVKGAARYELIHEPGTKWTYSGIGYCVAGRVAEAALGDQSFEKVSQDALFRPMGMHETTFAPTPERPFILVGGALRSTLDDMAVFGQMHLNDGEYNGKQYLSQASVTDQRRLQIPEERFRAPGLGWHRGFPDEDGLADLVFISGASGPHFQVDRRRQTVTVFLVRTSLQKVVPLFTDLNQHVEQIFSVANDR
jgi:CubicO group peptidase (beta-lactamase class C family)/acetyl esterase/lipase